MKPKKLVSAVQAALSVTPEQQQHAKIVTEGAQSIFAAVQAATEGAESLWQTIVLCRSEGLTWAELESVDLTDNKGKAITKDADGNDITGRGGKVRALRLLDLGAYRAAKTRINSMLKSGISLLDGDGAPVSTKAAKELAKAKATPRGEKGEDGDSATPSNPNANAVYSYGDAVSMVKAAFAKLMNEPTMRKAFRDEIMLAARTLANDEAKSGKPVPGTVRVSAQRAKLAEAAAKQAAAVAAATVPPVAIAA